MRVRLSTYSTKPRGGVVHTLALAEALARAGHDVSVHALARGGDTGFFRPVDPRVDVRLVGVPEVEGEGVGDRILRSIDLLAEALRGAAPVDVRHAQDCLSANAEGLAGSYADLWRTVHHLDEFTTPALAACHERALVEPAALVCVSAAVAREVRSGWGRVPTVIGNGVDAARFAAAERDGAGAPWRARHGRYVLAVGGIEPRKGTRYAFEALARTDPRPVLAVVGGHSFQDYAAYREETLAALPGLGLELGRDVVLLGTLSEQDLGDWYGSADALVFPSVKEGWGLAVLEAMAAGLPVVASDLPVFHEYLVHGGNALLPPVADPPALAAAMRSLATDPALRERLRAGGYATVPLFAWERSARRHGEIYDALPVPAH